MCRMLIAAGKINSKELFQVAIAMAKDQTSTHEFNEANGQGSWLHDDGWGIAWLEKGNWQSFKSTTAIFDDPQINTFSNLKSNFVMIHIRKRMGSETAIQNTHPFHLQRNDVGDFMFCHNGYAGDNFSFDPSFEVKGDTDSEKIFYSILTKMKEQDVQSSIKEVLNSIETTTGSNIILANKEKSFIASKENQYPKYYNMYIGKRKGTVVIASEKLNNLTGFVWQPTLAGEIISLDYRNLEITELNKKKLKQMVNN